MHAGLAKANENLIQKQNLGLFMELEIEVGHDFALIVGTSLISAGTVARIPLAIGRAENRKGDERREAHMVACARICMIQHSGARGTPWQRLKMMIDTYMRCAFLCVFSSSWCC